MGYHGDGRKKETPLLLGRDARGYSTTFGAIFDAKNSKLDEIVPDPVRAALVDPEVWINESFELAKTFAYASPVSMGKDARELTREYETNARNVSRAQLALAGARLANIINSALK